MHKRQVIIVGAGPAGATAALFLHRLGISFYLLDKAIFPRVKACADTVTSKPLRILNDLGLQPFDWGVGVAMSGVKFLSHKGNTAPIHYKSLYPDTNIPSCLAIPRAEFDLKLVDEVDKRAPNSFFQGVKIKGIEKGQQGIRVLTQEGVVFDSEILILATGSNSNWPQQLGIQNSETANKFWGLGLRAYYKGVEWPKESESWFGLSQKLMPGGIYASPVGNGLVNLNVVVRGDNPNLEPNSLKQIFRENLNQIPAFKTAFKDAELVGEFAGSRLRYGTQKRKLSAERVLLVGDAGGLVDLASSNGIANAMVSARIASEFVKQSLESGQYQNNSFHSYDTVIWAAVEKELKFGRMISGMMDYSWTRKALLWGSDWVAGLSKQSNSLSSVVYHPEPKALLKGLFKGTLTR